MAAGHRHHRLQQERHALVGLEGAGVEHDLGALGRPRRRSAGDHGRIGVGLERDVEHRLDRRGGAGPTRSAMTGKWAMTTSDRRITAFSRTPATRVSGWRAPSRSCPARRPSRCPCRRRAARPRAGPATGRTTRPPRGCGPRRSPRPRSASRTDRSITATLSELAARRPDGHRADARHGGPEVAQPGHRAILADRIGDQIDLVAQGAQRQAAVEDADRRAAGASTPDGARPSGPASRGLLAASARSGPAARHRAPPAPSGRRGRRPRRGPASGR